MIPKPGITRDGLAGTEQAGADCTLNSSIRKVLTFNRIFVGNAAAVVERITSHNRVISTTHHIASRQLSRIDNMQMPSGECPANRGLGAICLSPLTTCSGRPHETKRQCHNSDARKGQQERGYGHSHSGTAHKY